MGANHIEDLVLSQVWIYCDFKKNFLIIEIIIIIIITTASLVVS